MSWTDQMYVYASPLTTSKREINSSQMNIGSSLDTGGKDIVHVGRGGPSSVVEATVFLPHPQS